LQNKSYQELKRESSLDVGMEVVDFNPSNIELIKIATFDNTSVGNRILRFNRIDKVPELSIVISKLNSFITIDDGLSPQRYTQEGFLEGKYFHFKKKGGIK